MAVTDLPDRSRPDGEVDFDIVKTYRELLRDDPDLTMPVAAIEALVTALSVHPSSTISETLALLQTYTETLKRSIPNPISLSAGTDLFTRYLITTINRSGNGSGVGDFAAIRTHLLQNGKLFVERAKQARDKIAGFGRHFVRDGCTILTNGGSRVVGALLRSAAETSGGGGKGSVRFRVIYVLSAPPPTDPGDHVNGSHFTEGWETVTALRARGVPVATISEGAVGYSMGKVDMVIVGAEGVVENGGIISRLGTYQIGLLAKAKGKPLYVVAESHKFVRLFPLGQYDLPIEQNVIDFKVDGEPQTREDEKETSSDKEAKISGSGDMNGAVDFTPPDLISGIITESGVLTPSAVSEELIKIWF